MTTQDILGRSGPLSGFPPLPLNAPAAPHPQDTTGSRDLGPAVNHATPGSHPDPDATVVIGRHRDDGTRDFRPVGTGDFRPVRTRRGGWVGRVAAATVSRLWRRGAGR